MSLREKGEDERAVEEFIGKQKEERERRSKQAKQAHLAATCIQKSFRGKVGFLRFQCAKYEGKLSHEWDLLKVFKMLLQRQGEHAQRISRDIVKEGSASLLDVRKRISTSKLDTPKVQTKVHHQNVGLASGIHLGTFLWFAVGLCLTVHKRVVLFNSLQLLARSCMPGFCLHIVEESRLFKRHTSRVFNFHLHRVSSTFKTRSKCSFRFCLV